MLSFYINIVLTLSIGHNWEPPLILKNCHCRVRYLHQFLIFPTLTNSYFKVNMVKLSITGAVLWKCLISAFHHFLHPLFQNYQGWPIIPNFSLLTWYIVINRYVRLQNCLLWHVKRSIRSLDIVDYVSPTIFVDAINGYIWHLSWIFMFLLKSSKLFVTNLSTTFILGILIYHIQFYESSKLLVFGKVNASLKITH